MAGWVQEPSTGQVVWQGDDGLVHLKDATGEVQLVHPGEVGALLANPERNGFTPATADDINRGVMQKEWQDADFATKADFYAREGVKGVADAVTALPRAGVALGRSAIKGATGEDIGNPLEALSGEQLVEKLDAFVAGDEAARQEAERSRRFAEVAPLGKEAANLAGFVTGGAALRGLGAAGEALAGSGLLGEGSAAARIGSLAAEGATQSYAAGSEEAWVKDSEYTADAALANMGIGAALGGALGGVSEGIKAGVPAARRALAEKLFGRGLSKESEQATNEMLEDVVGTKPPKGMGQYFKDAMDYLRDKAETVQSVASGVPKEDLEKFGGLRWTDEAISFRQAHENRAAILEAVSNDLTDAMQVAHEESQPILDEVSRASGQKIENIRKSLTGDTDTMLKAAKEKAAGIEDALNRLDETKGPRVRSINGEPEVVRRPVMGEGKQIEDIRSAMEDTVDTIRKTDDPAEAVHALDEFKARMQRAKVNAESTSYRVTSGLEIEQARARAAFANDVSEDMRSFLENDSIWGDFGKNQKQVNQAYARFLDSRKYIAAHLFERTGEDFGRPRYVIDPRKIASYVDGLGTTKSKTLDGLVRDHIEAQRDLVESIVKSYGLDAHEKGMQKVLGSVKVAQELLDKATNTVGKANIVEEALKRASSSHGTLGITGAVLGGAPGAGIGAVLGNLMDPVKLIHQATALREMSIKWGKGVDSDIRSAFLSRTQRAAETAKSVGRVVRTEAQRAAGRDEEDSKARYQRISKELTTSMADPMGMAKKIGDAMGHIEHPAVRDQMITGAMRAADFLHSKLPGPVYGGSPLTPNQLASVAPSDRAKFLRYYEAVQDPGVVFRQMREGKYPPPEHMEALKTCYPALYQRAQQAVFDAAHRKDSSGQPPPLQTRCMLAQLFDQPWLIEPTLDPGFQNRIAQAFNQGAQTEAQKQTPPPKAIKGNLSDSMKSPFDKLSV
jgi:hypothetical protein